MTRLTTSMQTAKRYWEWFPSQTMNMKKIDFCSQNWYRHKKAKTSRQLVHSPSMFEFHIRKFNLKIVALCYERNSWLTWFTVPSDATDLTFSVAYNSNFGVDCCDFVYLTFCTFRKWAHLWKFHKLASNTEKEIWIRHFSNQFMK